MNVVCCQVEVSATGRSLVQRNHTVWVCVCVCARARARAYVCVSLGVIWRNGNPINLKWVCRRGQTKKREYFFSIFSLEHLYHKDAGGYVSPNLHNHTAGSHCVITLKTAIWHSLNPEASVSHVATKSAASGTTSLFNYTLHRSEASSLYRSLCFHAYCMSFKSKIKVLSVSSTVTVVLANHSQICGTADGRAVLASWC